VARAEAADIRPPALTIVGPVVTLRERIGWFEQRALHGRRLLVLSTREEGGAIEPRLDGAELDRVAPFAIVPRFAEVKRALADLDRYRTVAFASAHAVDAVVGALMASGRDLRALAGVRLAAVGAATARRLEEVHLRADVQANGGGAALAAEIRAASCEGPVLLPRAHGGREELREALVAAGYTVEAVDAYDSVLDEAALARAARTHRLRPYDAIAFASPKGASAFLSALGGAARLGPSLVGAIGETTRAALVEAGVTVTVVPPEPSLPVLVDALAQALAARAKIE
jgi:uroporphyrinogen III methyltransferase/synthase